MKGIIIAMAVLAVLSGCIKEKQTGADLQVGSRLPDFEVVMSDGETVTDQILQESVSVVMFFHTSCPDCQQVLPQMQRVYDEYAPKGVRIVLISREDTEERIESFWQEKGLKMPYSAPKDRKIYEKFAATRIPRVYVNEKGGIIRYVFTDDPNPSYDEICTALENVIR